MGGFLRDPGTNAVVGLSAVSAAFAGIALSIYGADTERRHDWAFFLALAIGISFAFAAVASLIFVGLDSWQRGKKIQKLREFIWDGHAINAEILEAILNSQAPETLGDKALAWANEIQKWLDKSLPSHGPDFLASDDEIEKLFAGVKAGKAQSWALFMGRRLHDLRGMLVDIRW